MLSDATPVTGPRVYWPGNSAKSEVLRRVAAAARQRGSLVVLDFGIGDGGAWPSFLSVHPDVQLIAVEPHAPFAAKAADRLAGTSARILGLERLPELRAAADIVVSFSVLEHVWDRQSYLESIKLAMAPDGTCFLNYDDGHFRGALPLDMPRTWPGVLLNGIRTALAPVHARRSRYATYQRRVNSNALDDDLRTVGLTSLEVFYSNCGDFKTLYASIPHDQRDAFMEFWLNTERTLNEQFSHTQSEVRGDRQNLWHTMGSRTLVLRHSRDKSHGP